MNNLNVFPFLAAASFAFADPSLIEPTDSPGLGFEEKGGFVAVEAEHFIRQEKDDARAWYLTTGQKQAGREKGVPTWKDGKGIYLHFKLQETENSWLARITGNKKWHRLPADSIFDGL